MSCNGLRRAEWRSCVLQAIVCLGIWAGNVSQARAVEHEVREFAVRIDGEPAGAYRMTIDHPDERTYIVEADANVAVRYLVVKYKYTYQGVEVWKDGRLVHLKSTSNDNGKRFEVLVKPDRDGLRVQVNGREHSIRPTILTTTYWRLPDGTSRSAPVSLLDCDTGKDLNGLMQYVGAQQISVGGQVQDCAHYRITGGVQVDLWYDAQQRLVREQSLEDGHKALLELTRISH